MVSLGFRLPFPIGLLQIYRELELQTRGPIDADQQAVERTLNPASDLNETQEALQDARMLQVYGVSDAAKHDGRILPVTTRTALSPETPSPPLWIGDSPFLEEWALEAIGHENLQTRLLILGKGRTQRGPWGIIAKRRIDV